MPDIIHRIGFKAPIHLVFKALASTKGISNWWTENVKGNYLLGNDIEVVFKNIEGYFLGSMIFKIIELEENALVQWKFSEGPSEWIGTEAVFELSEEDNYTILIFKHQFWKEEVEFKAHCSMKWAIFLMSLKEFVETGTGKASPHDIKIDNWN